MILQGYPIGRRFWHQSKARTGLPIVLNSNLSAILPPLFRTPVSDRCSAKISGCYLFPWSSSVNGMICWGQTRTRQAN